MQNQSIGQQLRQIMDITKFSAAIALGTLGWIGGTIAPTILIASVQAAPANWTFDPATQQLEVIVPTGTTPRFFLAAEPARIILEIPNAELGTITIQQAYASGAVQQIRAAQFQPNLYRIVVEMHPDTVFAPGQAELKQVSSSSDGDRWVLRPLLAGEPIAAASSSSTPAIAPSTSAVSSDLPNRDISNEAPPESSSLEPSSLESSSLESSSIRESEVHTTPITAADFPVPDLAQAEGDRQPGTIDVPSLESQPSPAAPSPPSAPQAAPPAPQATPIPVPSPDSSPAPTPPPSPFPSPSPSPAPTASPSNIIEFGQPLPPQ